jgi:hypothetical protein
MTQKEFDSFDAMNEFESMNEISMNDISKVDIEFMNAEVPQSGLQFDNFDM